MDELKHFIQSIVHIKDEDLKCILSCFKEIIIKKDKYVLKEKHISTSYYFIKSGGVRIWLNKDGKPITAWLLFENSFFCELASLQSAQPAHFNIQAITDTSLYAIDKNAMENLYAQFSLWERFGRLIWERAFLKVIDGFVSFQTLTAEERYRVVMQQSNLLQKIPLKQLASYLGITPTSLSRIRKNLR